MKRQTALAFLMQITASDRLAEFRPPIWKIGLTSRPNLASCGFRCGALPPPAPLAPQTTHELAHVFDHPAADSDIDWHHNVCRSLRSRMETLGLLLHCPGLLGHHVPLEGDKRLHDSGIRTGNYRCQSHESRGSRPAVDTTLCVVQKEASASHRLSDGARIL